MSDRNNFGCSCDDSRHSDVGTNCRSSRDSLIKNGCGIDVNRILDSCRDKDCYENVRVFLTGCGQDVIEKTNNIRVKSACIVWTQLSVEPVQFNRGFYSVDVRFYTKLVFEGCICPGKPIEFEGIAVTEKRVVLFGSEGCVKIFRSEQDGGDFCSCPCDIKASSNLPIAVCEVADPVVLGCKVIEPMKCKCCCACCDLPERVCHCCSEPLTDSNCSRHLAVTLGFFSVLRMERPGQYIISATEYSVPDKECCSPEENDPCALFRKMCFPVSEFYPPSC
ncbi:MAG: hypothetical protein IKL81_01415 [Clostridia bacterium]|nr:hypothetical protein [Clostridia bacterium]